MTPRVPGEVAAKPGNRSATIGWIAPQDDVQVVAYVITAYKVGSDEYTSRRIGGGATRVVFTGLENGKEYQFSVKAVGKLGLSAESELTSPITPLSPDPKANGNDKPRNWLFSRLLEYLSGLVNIRAESRGKQIDARHEARQTAIEAYQDAAETRVKALLDAARAKAELRTELAAGKRNEQNAKERAADGLNRAEERASGKLSEIDARAAEKAGQAAEKRNERLANVEQNKKDRLESIQNKIAAAQDDDADDSDGENDDRGGSGCLNSGAWSAKWNRAVLD